MYVLKKTLCSKTSYIQQNNKLSNKRMFQYIQPHFLSTPNNLQKKNKNMITLNLTLNRKFNFLIVQDSPLLLKSKRAKNELNKYFLHTIQKGFNPMTSFLISIPWDRSLKMTSLLKRNSERLLIYPMLIRNSRTSMPVPWGQLHN